jgi:hypothetical protein
MGQSRLPLFSRLSELDVQASFLKSTSHEHCSFWTPSDFRSRGYTAVPLERGRLAGAYQRFGFLLAGKLSAVGRNALGAALSKD